MVNDWRHSKPAWFCFINRWRLLLCLTLQLFVNLLFLLIMISLDLTLLNKLNLLFDSINRLGTPNLHFLNSYLLIKIGIEVKMSYVQILLLFSNWNEKVVFFSFFAHSYCEVVIFKGLFESIWSYV